MKVHIVCGANLGDEGKGMSVDFLTSLADDPIVVRFNGGANAGHTVETPDGRRHVFHHFGSGTFLGAPTFLSKFFVVDPTAFLREFEDLSKLNCSPKVYVDINAHLVTPFDVVINQTAEHNRGNNKHGSCGFGINETITRNGTHVDFSTTVFDLLHPIELRKKLIHIKDSYVKTRLELLGMDGNIDICDSDIDNFIDECAAMFHHVTIVPGPEFLKNFESVIFEGAQGLLLDEFHPWFPHVTRSRTGVFNACEILKEIGIDEANVLYITRSYLTRHGAGPLPFEVAGPIYEGIVDNTNVPNPHQGTLRFAPFNFDLIEESIIDDLNTVSGINLFPNLVVTCVNQVPEEVKYVTKGRVVETARVDFLYKLICSVSVFEERAGTVLFSRSPNRDGFSLI